MNNSTILVTGGAGFIGSNICVFLKKRFPRAHLIALDSLKRRGSELNLPRLAEHGIPFVHADIRNPEDLVLARHIDLVIECSAEPSVLAGTGDNPSYLINTNLAGTVNCLELCRKHRADLLFLSTSRVYPFEALNRIRYRRGADRFQWCAGKGETGWSKQGISESFTTDGPKSLYGATKLCAEHLIREYADQYGIRALINRCGVVAGPWQFGKTDQGIFSYWFLNHYFKRPLNYIGFGGSGLQVRDFLHIDDLCELIAIQLQRRLRTALPVYSVGGGMAQSLSLREATHWCQRISGNRVAIGRETKTRYGDVALFITDARRAQKEFSWRPRKTAETLFSDLLEWTRNNERALERSLQRT